MKHTAYPDARGGRLRVGVHGPAGRDAGVRAARVRADRRDARLHREGAGAVQLGADPRRRDRLARTARACTPPTCRRRASTAPRRPAASGRAPPPTRRRASRCSAPATAFRYAAIRRPIKNAAHARLRAHHDVRRAGHRADSAEQRVQRWPTSTCRWTTRTRRSTSSRGATGARASTPRRGANSARAQRRHRPRRSSIARVRTRDNNYLQDRKAMKLGDYTGIPRHPQPGHGDVGDDGADRGPHAASASAPATSRSCSSAASWSTP